MTMQPSSMCSRLIVAGIVGLTLQSGAQAQYGSTSFEASGSREAHAAFTTGLLQLHNFEYEDARQSFLEAQGIDPDFVMAYWGEALTHEHPLWNQQDLAAARAALGKLGSTPADRVAKAPTEREKAYIHSVNLLFGEGSEEERDFRYRDALAEIHRRYPQDIDAIALHALATLTTSHGGRDFSIYMQAGALAGEALELNSSHPGALHYTIHSFDDPIHAPLGLRAADAYGQVAPSAVHALHMGSHIYFALGMWEQGTDRNRRAFEEAVARSPEGAPFSGHAYHALTWLIYSLAQQGELDEASRRLAQIEDQTKRFEGPVHRTNFALARASYVVDTEDLDGRFATIAIDHAGISPLAAATDHYVRGIVALHRGDRVAAEAALAAIDDSSAVDSVERPVMAPRLLKMALEAQLALQAGDERRAVALLEEAADLEASLAPDYGPAVPAQPVAELLADTYLALGDTQQAAAMYREALASYVGRARSLEGLAAAESGQALTRVPGTAGPVRGGRDP
jgi:tetratricopeptide (TPR) repeat protein